VTDCPAITVLVGEVSFVPFLFQKKAETGAVAPNASTTARTVAVIRLGNWKCFKAMTSLLVELLLLFDIPGGICKAALDLENELKGFANW